MKNKDEKPDKEVELRFTCPDCGHEELAECYGGYVSRTFFKAVACRPAGPEEENQDGEKGQRYEIRYASLEDGSKDCDYVEDNYGVNSSCWYACSACDSVLEFEGGSAVEDEEELAEWLRANCPPEDSDSASPERNDGED